MPFDGLQPFQFAGKAFAQMLKKPQRLIRVGELVHQVNLGEVREAVVPQGRLAQKPPPQSAPAGGCRFVKQAPRTALRGRATPAQHALFLQAIQRGINLTQFRRPKMADAVIEHLLEVVAAGRLAEQAEQDLVQSPDTTI